jgi:hypothetical protein
MRDQPTPLADSTRAERFLPPFALQAGLPLALVLVALFLLAGGVRADSRPNELSKELSGHGQTEADAEQDALDQARAWVVSVLQERRPALSWEPSSSYLRESGIAKRVKHDSAYSSDSLGSLHKVTLRVEVGEEALRKMLQQDRLHQRHLLAAKVLAALVALLIVLAIYFRLEEITRGYYTGPLRGGLVLCLLAIAAGVWFTW